jgi:hypothetical protein
LNFVIGSFNIFFKDDKHVGNNWWDILSPLNHKLHAITFYKVEYSKVCTMGFKWKLIEVYSYKITILKPQINEWQIHLSNNSHWLIGWNFLIEMYIVMVSWSWYVWWFLALRQLLLHNKNSFCTKYYDYC